MHRRLICKLIQPTVALLLIGSSTIAVYAGKHFVSPKQSTHYAKYYNVRYNYSVEYPSPLLKPQPEAANGDGRRFASLDGAIDMRIWGQYNVLNRTVKDECQTEIDSISGNPKIIYQKIGKDFYTFTGTKRNTIFYIYAIYRSDRFITMRLVYPGQSAKRIAPYLQHIAKSIKAN